MLCIFNLSFCTSIIFSLGLTPFLIALSCDHGWHVLAFVYTFAKIKTTVFFSSFSFSCVCRCHNQKEPLPLQLIRNRQLGASGSDPLSPRNLLRHVATCTCSCTTSEAPPPPAPASASKEYVACQPIAIVPPFMLTYYFS